MSRGRSCILSVQQEYQFSIGSFLYAPKTPPAKGCFAIFFFLFEVFTAFLLSCSSCSSLQRICTIPLRQLLVNACVNFVFFFEAAVDQIRSSRYQIIHALLYNICACVKK